MQIIGHRGAKGLAPENTIAGIRYALRRKIDWIEFDVRTTKDGEPVVIHDDTLMRIAKQGKRVRDCDLAEIQHIATTSGEAIPTLDEVLTAIGRKAKVNIELKDVRSARRVVQRVKKQVKAGRPYDDFLISSFSVRTLYVIQRRDANIPIALLHRLWPLTFMFLPGLRLTGVGFFGFSAPRAAIMMAKHRGLWTYIYTINHRDVAKRFERMGVDAIVTDRPNAFLSLWPAILRWGLAAALLLLFCYVMWFSLF